MQVFNPNPTGRNVGDCAIRAVALATGDSWDLAYVKLCLEGFLQCDLQNSNAVWGAHLSKNGFKKGFLPDSCVDGYTVRDFAKDHQKGTYVLALSAHVVCVIDGELWDSWDSQNEIVLYYFVKNKE